jgi:hypothetical protein
MANKFVTFLDKLGSDALKVLTFGLVVAKDVQPEVDVALNLAGLTGVTTLFNNVITLASGVQGVANGVTGTGPTKLALVVAGVTPAFEEFLQNEGVTMNTAQINAWVSAAVNLVMAIPAPNSSSTPVTTQLVTPVVSAIKS